MDKRRLRGTLLSRASERRLESGALLPGSCDRMTANSFSRRFMSDTVRNFFTEGVVKHWNWAQQHREVGGVTFPRRVQETTRCGTPLSS